MGSGYGWLEEWNATYSVYGYNWTDYFAKFWNSWLTETVTGVNTKDTAGAVTNIILEGASIKYPAIGYFNTLKSLLQSFVYIYGSVTAGYSSDKTIATVNYDKIEKVTICTNPSWSWGMFKSNTKNMDNKSLYRLILRI